MSFVTGRTFAIPYGDKGVFISVGGGGANGGPRNAHIDPVHARFTKPWEGEGLPFGDYRGKGGMKGSCGWICIDVEKGSAPSQEKRKTIRHLT